MITVEIPGFKKLEIRHLVLDFNGTVSFDGRLISGVTERILQLSQKVKVYVLTADTTGTCVEQLFGLPLTVSILNTRPEDEAKLAFVRQLGTDACACIGNGVNDHRMLEACVLGIAVIGPECTASKAVFAAHVIAPGIIEALDLLINPVRLLATLRS